MRVNKADFIRVFRDYPRNPEAAWEELELLAGRTVAQYVLVPGEGKTLRVKATPLTVHFFAWKARSGSRPLYRVTHAGTGVYAVVVSTIRAARLVAEALEALEGMEGMAWGVEELETLRHTLSPPAVSAAIRAIAEEYGCNEC